MGFAPWNIEPEVAFYFRAILKLDPHVEHQLIGRTVKNRIENVLVDMIYQNILTIYLLGKKNCSYNLSPAN